MYTKDLILSQEELLIELKFNKRTCTKCNKTKNLNEDFSNCKVSSNKKKRVCKKCMRKYARNRFKEYEHVRERVAFRSRRDNLRRKYGLSVEQYDEMFSRQNGLCSICKSPPKNERPLCVDHCHDSNKVRSLLCDACNKMLADAKDSQEILQAGIDYLNKHQSAF